MSTSRRSFCAAVMGVLFAPWRMLVGWWKGKWYVCRRNAWGEWEPLFPIREVKCEPIAVLMGEKRSSPADHKRDPDFEMDWFGMTAGEPMTLNGKPIDPSEWVECPGDDCEICGGEP